MSFRLPARTVIEAPLFVVLCALAMNALNPPLLHYLYRNLAVDSLRDAAFAASLPLACLAATALVLSLLLTNAARKWIAGLLFVVNAFVSYYGSTYGVVVSSDLVRNGFESNASEAAELVTPGLLAYTAFLGFGPLLALRLVDVLEPKQHARTGEYSHDNLFHSMLGLFGIETGVRDPTLDVFGVCATGTGAGSERPMLAGG